MIQKIKQWFERRKHHKTNRRRFDAGMELPYLYTREQVLKMMEEAKQIGYNDGRSDGIAIARQQATKSLKEILWHQNKQTKANQK